MELVMAELITMLKIAFEAVLKVITALPFLVLLRSRLENLKSKNLQSEVLTVLLSRENSRSYGI
jgi:hypothetical protein